MYAGYYDYSEPASKMAGHRVLAVDRGEARGFLKVSVEVERRPRAGSGAAAHGEKSVPVRPEVREAAADAYARLIHPSLGRKCGPV